MASPAPASLVSKEVIPVSAECHNYLDTTLFEVILTVHRR